MFSNRNKLSHLENTLIQNYKVFIQFSITIFNSSAFKCEKDSGKKYFFHADHEVDREAWIKELNLTARGERKPKELGAGQIHEVDGRKGSISGLKVSAPTNRPRTGSVLAGVLRYSANTRVESTWVLQRPAGLLVK